MLQSLLNNVESLSPQDGHVLVVGDIWINQADVDDSDESSAAWLRHCSAAGLALAIAGQDRPVTLVGFVGDDELAAAMQRRLEHARVTTDLLHIKQWPTFTDAHLRLPIDLKEKLDANGRRLRRHKDERALPIDGMSEYEAHLQNRAERYLRNASAVVLVDFALGSIAEPRALIYVANQLGVPSVSVLGRSVTETPYANASSSVDVTAQPNAAATAQVLTTLSQIAAAQ